MSSLLYQQYTNIYDGAIQKCKECLERNDLAEASSYLSSAIEAPMPAKGNYYFKIVNNSGSDIKFLSIQYTYQPCHCLRVVVND